MRDLDPLVFLARDFWNDVAKISRIATAKVTAPGAALWDVQMQVCQALGNAYPVMVEHLLAYAVELLGLPRMGGGGRNASASSKQTDDFLLRCAQVFELQEHRKLEERDVQTRGDELLMENLAAAWLGLYFLGLPFSHPWEKVRRLADYRGGFPSGACIAKYAGDIYRLARHRMRERTPTGAQAALLPGYTDHDAAVLVLSHTPLILLQDALGFQDQTNVTPSSVHQLGRLYTLLQMMLYLRCDYPVHFFIPISALGQSLRTLAGIPDDPKAAPTNPMRQAYTRVRDSIRPWLFGRMVPTHTGQQTVSLLTLPSDASGMPTCVLGNKTGIYTLESGDSGLHFAGNEINEALLASYRDKLKMLFVLKEDVGRHGPYQLDEDTRIISLLDLNEPTFDDLFRKLFPDL